AVVGVAACFGAHDGDAHFREQVPVRVEVPRGGVEELEACQIRGAAAVADQRCVEDAAECVGGQQVLLWVADEGDAVGDRFECPVQAGAGGVLFGCPPPWSSGGGDAVGGACEIEQVGSFGVVELQCLCDGVENR